MSKIKIFISCKNKYELVQSDIVRPIQTGRGIATEIFEDMIGDNTGDNISKDNPRYNELSAQYWVWKNYEKVGNPDYIGFMHYRRHFVFDKSIETSSLTPWFKGMHIYTVNNYNQRCVNNLSDKNILNTISDNADCYVISPYDVSFFEENQLRCMPEHFYETIPGMKKEVWEVFYNTVKSLYPQYVDILDDFSNGSLMNCCNMFIMKKDLFFEYNDFCFNILKEVDRQIDSSKFDKQEQRFLGYLGEYVLSIFVRILQKRNSKVKYLDAIMFMTIQNICTISLKPIQKLFCITNSGNKKLISIFGKRFYLNRWDNKKEFAKLTMALHEQSKTIEKLNKKIEKLQRELETINRG
jgi:hypothetical protein